MNAFSTGPFTFDPAARGVKINGKQSRAWTLNYGDREIASRTLAESLSLDEVKQEFGAALASFTTAAKRKHGPQTASLVEFGGGEVPLEFARDPGITAGLIDDRHRWWLRSSDGLRSLAILSLREFAAIAQRCVAPPNHWITGLLPDAVLTDNPEDWRAPSSWEIRHVVGEGSFTGISGARAAALVGVTAQNFRKYTARDDAATRQKMSFSMWHLLLHRLGVQLL